MYAWRDELPAGVVLEQPTRSRYPLSGMRHFVVKLLLDGSIETFRITPNYGYKFRPDEMGIYNQIRNSARYR
jgi:hypothetical protein